MLLEHERHFGGVTMFLETGLRTLVVAPSQRDGIAEVRSKLRASMNVARVADTELERVLAAGIDAGGIDDAKVIDAIEHLRIDAASAQPAAVDTINELHTMLTAGERTALGALVQRRWVAWLAANPVDANAGPVALASTIDMTPAQFDASKPAFVSLMKQSPALDVAAVEQALTDFEAAFASPAFDPQTFPRATSGELAAWSATRLARFCEAALPVLTPHQRDKLAGFLRHDVNDLFARIRQEQPWQREARGQHELLGAARSRCGR
jgi:hypothetical protein